MHNNTKPQDENEPLPQIPTDEKIRIIANLIIDRILENKIKKA